MMSSIDNVKVSVIVPVFNTERYVGRCVGSICAQTLKDIEIICVNDASTDNSLALLNGFALCDSRIRVVDLPENSGVSVARNRGIEMAKGEYIYFIDSDDWIDDGFLETMYIRIKEQNVEIVINTFYKNEYDDKSKNTVSSYPDFPPEGSMADPRRIQREFLSVIVARLYSRNFIMKHGLRFPVIKGGGEDIWFTAACELHLDRIYVFRSPYAYHYYQRPASVSHTSSKGFHYLENFSALYDYLVAEGIQTDGLRLYFVESLVIDSEDKFTFVKDYLLRIRPQFMRNLQYYNEQDKFLMKIACECSDYAAFRAEYSPNISISFIRQRMAQKR